MIIFELQKVSVVSKKVLLHLAERGKVGIFAAVEVKTCNARFIHDGIEDPALKIHFLAK